MRKKESDVIHEPNSGHIGKLNNNLWFFFVTVFIHFQGLTGWQPKTSDHSQWLAIDLMKAYKITGIAIQAGNWQDDSSSGTFGNWVTRYKVQFSDSNNPSDYIDYTLNGAVQVRDTFFNLPRTWL